MIVILLVSLLTGFLYRLPPAPEYTTNLTGATTQELYSNFMSTTKSGDTKVNIDNSLTDAEAYLTVFETSVDYENLLSIDKDLQIIAKELYNYYSEEGSGTCSYIENNSISQINSTILNLSSFVSRFEDYEQFESNIIFKTTDFERLKSIADKWYAIIDSTSDVETVLQKLYESYNDFSTINAIVNNVFVVIGLDSEIALKCENNYILEAEEKAQNILTEIEKIRNESTYYDTTNLDEMKSLITNYKLTLESAKRGIELELNLAIRFSVNRHYGSVKNLMYYEPIAEEEAKIALTKINALFKDENLYYTQYQGPLNFNTASYQVSLYDKAYFMMSIIGFLTIIFGIFLSYKLFGLDRKNGKLDTILSQNVSFNQVFSGKFLAILFSTSFVLAVYSIISLTFGALLYPSLSNTILAVFNTTTVYTIYPIFFFLIKIIGIEFQVIFYSILTIFLMNISRKFNLCFAIALGIFTFATIGNIFLNNLLVYCLFPFIHADLTCFLGGGIMDAGFLQTPLYSYGNFFISLVYYLVVVILLYNFTKQLFKKS